MRDKRLFLDAFDTIGEKFGDLRFSIVVTDTVGVEVCLPINDRTIRLVIDFKPELGLVVFNWQGAFQDLVAVASGFGAGQLVSDFTAIFQRERTNGRVVLFGLNAIGCRWM